MKFLLAQIILAARKGDAENWMNILFIVAIVVFYAVANIVKARANKSKEQQGEQAGRKPVLEPSEHIREGDKAPQRRPYQQVRRAPGQPAHRIAQAPPARREVGRPRPAVQKLAAETEEAISLAFLKPSEEPELPVPRPKLQPKIKEVPELIGEPIKKLEEKRLGLPAREEQAAPAVERLLDFEEPDELRRAILHYEILGKPLSLRESSDRIF